MEQKIYDTFVEFPPAGIRSTFETKLYVETYVFRDSMRINAKLSHEPEDKPVRTLSDNPNLPSFSLKPLLGSVLLCINAR